MVTPWASAFHIGDAVSTLGSNSASFATFAVMAADRRPGLHRSHRPGAQSKTGRGRPTKYDLRECDEHAFFERPENRVRAQGSQRTLIDGDHSLAKALRD